VLSWSLLCYRRTKQRWLLLFKTWKTQWTELSKVQFMGGSYTLLNYFVLFLKYSRTPVTRIQYTVIHTAILRKVVQWKNKRLIYNKELPLGKIPLILVFSHMLLHPSGTTFLMKWMYITPVFSCLQQLVYIDVISPLHVCITNVLIYQLCSNRRCKQMQTLPRSCHFYYVQI